MLGLFMAKGLVDLSFGGAFMWYLVKFLVSVVVAYAAIVLGIKLRKSKNSKAELETAGADKEA